MNFSYGWTREDNSVRFWPAPRRRIPMLVRRSAPGLAIMLHQQTRGPRTQGSTIAYIGHNGLVQRGWDLNGWTRSSIGAPRRVVRPNTRTVLGCDCPGPLLLSRLVSQTPMTLGLGVKEGGNLGVIGRVVLRRRHQTAWASNPSS